MITHVAIIREGKIFCLPSPNRHHHILPIIKEVLGENWQAREDDDIEGFLDHERRFLNREEAYIVAKNNGQLNRKSDGYSGNQLFSEDLW